MRRQPSLFLRISRALVGLVTLWCLGCSSYEPLLASLIGSNAATAMMECGPEMSGPPTAATSATAEQGPAQALAVSSADGHRGFDCGCGGMCHAPSPSSTRRAVMAAPILSLAEHRPSSPATVVRAPLLPPPEFGA